MTRLPLSSFGAGVLSAILLLAVPTGVNAQQAGSSERGKVVYTRWCMSCHGESGAGDGDGAKYMVPRPRDFTRGSYQIRTTKSGELPSDEDLLHVIDEGMPGTAMPGWRTLLSQEQRADVIAYLKTLSPAFKRSGKLERLTFGSAPGSSDETLKDGQAVFEKLQCSRCHGTGGRGDGSSAPTLVDSRGDRIRAADLTKPWLFNGGGTVEDIYHRLRTGLDGTPMASFSDVIDSKIITDEQLWHVAQYVRSLAPEEAPETREVIRRYRLEEGLPSGPDDQRWNAIDPTHIPMAGQVIVAPRAFAPRVAALWVRAVHDDKSVAILVSWTDPSKSPDTVWQEWLDGIAASITDADGALPREQSADRLHVQFPAKLTDGLERPYFLAGDSQRPAYQWRWTGQPDELRVGTATGLSAFTPGDAGGVTHRAVWTDGEWRLQFVRPLATPDAAKAPAFPVGTAIPIGFYAADGSSGETDVRGAVSTWYAIHLDVPTPASVFVAPCATALLTAVFGVFIVWRVQRRHRESSEA